MMKPINSLTSLSTLVVLFAMIQALDPVITKVVLDGKIAADEWWLLGRTGIVTLIAIAIKHKENPSEYTPNSLPGDNISEVYETLKRINRPE